MDTRKRLRARDWAVAGLDVLAEEGIEGVRVERLARRLGVTKGSFYHHYAARSDLFEAMLRVWAEASTFEVAETLRDKQISGRDAVAFVHEFMNARDYQWHWDPAVLAWASSHRQAEQAVRDVYQVRWDTITELFVNDGLPPARARSLALIVVTAESGNNVMPLADAETWAQAREDLLDRLWPEANDC